MAAIQIRRATSEDVVAIEQVVRSAYAPWQARLADLPDVAAGLADDIQRHVVWVATTSDSIVGVVVLVLGDTTPKLANLAVDPTVAGGGIGRRLVKKVEDYCRERGDAQVRLMTHRAMAPTLAFYGRLGWREKRLSKTG